MKASEIIAEVRKIKEKETPKSIMKFDLDQTERILLRLDSFTDCTECRKYMEEFSSLFEKAKAASLFTYEKEYALLIKSVLKHLQKSHKLVTKGYYANTYMALGIGLGLPFGVVFAQSLGQMAYIGIGLPIGIGIGLAIGSNLDTKAKNDSLVI